MKFLYVSVLTGLVLLFANCAQPTTYHAWQGGEVTSGSGGVKKDVDGVEVWIQGKPRQKHRVIGYIEDERPGGRFQRKRIHAALVQKAIENGGDAVVVLSSDVENLGSTTSAPTYTVSPTYVPSNPYSIQSSGTHSTALLKIYTKALVIKYIY